MKRISFKPIFWRKEARLCSAYLAILTIAGYHLPVEVLCDADDPGDGIHLELPLTVTVHHLVVDPPILTLHKRDAVKLYKNSEPVWTFNTVRYTFRIVIMVRTEKATFFILSVQVMLYKLQIQQIKVFKKTVFCR